VKNIFPRSHTEHCWRCSKKRHQQANYAIKLAGWSEPAVTNGPVEDEAVQAVLGMNQKHILLCPKFLVSSASSLPQSFSLLPTSLPPTFHLVYVPPPTYPTWFYARSVARAREHLKRDLGTPSSELGSTLSETQENVLEIGPRNSIIRAREHFKWGPRKCAWSWTHVFHRQRLGVF